MDRTCSICGTVLMILKDTPNYIVRNPEDVARFMAGELTLEELDKLATFQYDREFTCPCNSNPADEFKPCDNFGKVVETVAILDN